MFIKFKRVFESGRHECDDVKARCANFSIFKIVLYAPPLFLMHFSIDSHNALSAFMLLYFLWLRASFTALLLSRCADSLAAIIFILLLASSA